MSEEDRKVYEEALKQVISLHVVHKKVESIMELIDPFHPEMSDMKRVNQELKKFKDELLITIGENADVVWYIDEYKSRREWKMEIRLNDVEVWTLWMVLTSIVNEGDLLEPLYDKLSERVSEKNLNYKRVR